MALTRKGNTTTTTTKPSLMSRLNNRKSPRTVKTQTKHSTNPLTGAHTTTTIKKETAAPHSNGHGHHTATGSTGTAGTRHSTRTTGHTTGHTTTGTHHRRKPSMGDKVSGAMMKVKGSLTKKPGLKGAGTRRMHGTDGKGSHRTVY